MGGCDGFKSLQNGDTRESEPILQLPPIGLHQVLRRKSERRAETSTPSPRGVHAKYEEQSRRTSRGGSDGVLKSHGPLINGI